jgi:hypothetical protein
MPEWKGPLTRPWHWIKDQIVQDVPEDIGLCEYDCKKGQCTLGEWEACERRQCKAAGELMPAEMGTRVDPANGENSSMENPDLTLSESVSPLLDQPK